LLTDPRKTIAFREIRDSRIAILHQGGIQIDCTSGLSSFRIRTLLLFNGENFPELNAYIPIAGSLWTPMTKKILDRNDAIRQHKHAIAKQAPGFVDLRPSAIAQRKLVDLAQRHTVDFHPVQRFPAQQEHAAEGKNTAQLNGMEEEFSDADMPHHDQVALKWMDEIRSKNPLVLQKGIYKQDWYLMPYEEILEEESEAVLETLKGWFPQEKTDSNVLFQQIYTEDRLKQAHPLVQSFSPSLEPNGQEYKLALQFQINPTYTKYLDTSGKKIALRIVGDSSVIWASGSPRTDVLFQSQKIKVSGTETEVGHKMKARRLSQDHPVGMTSARDSKQDTLMKSLANVPGSGKTKYIKGHLLNDHLGGPARAENLFPITQEANGQHVYWVEKYVKAEVAAGYVMEYSVEVENCSIGSYMNFPTINSKFKCHSARLDIHGNPVDAYDITILSDWGLASNPLHDHVTSVNDPESLSVLKNKLNTGVPNKYKGNPDIKPVDISKYSSFVRPGYKQDQMADGSHAGVTLIDHTGALPFSMSGTKSKLSKATRADLVKVIGIYKAGMIPLRKKLNRAALEAIIGIGPKTVDALEKEFDLS